MRYPEIVIAGAGVVGLSVALEMRARGARVTVLESGRAMGEASGAAAGMLAVHDSANPVELLPLAELSAGLYAGYLDRIEELSGLRVAVQTWTTLEEVESGDEGDDVSAVLPELMAGERRFRLLDEWSVDPRELGEGLVAAVKAAGVELVEGCSLLKVVAEGEGMRVETSDERRLSAEYVIDCMGAWSPARVVPRKGQMLCVGLPESLALEVVVRAKGVYVVPRTQGMNAGRAVVGATVEMAGFDKTVEPRAMLGLHERACALLPQLREARYAESWAGLRPGTKDGLPVLGASVKQPRYVVANGMFRNGILLAPGVAKVVGEMVMGDVVSVGLERFGVGRFDGS